MRVLKWIGLVLGSLILIAVLYAFQPWVFLPHQKIQISLPFALEDDINTSLIPMGETIEHNASNGTPDGHPGIDFGWDQETNVIAVADGRIMRVYKNQDNQFAVEERLGLFYKTIYQELNKLDPAIKPFAKVKKGQVIGQTGFNRSVYGSERPPKGGPSAQLHWDFASSSMIIDRLCPVTYFDAESRARIEKIWARVPANNQFKIKFPKICNGLFDGKEE